MKVIQCINVLKYAKELKFQLMSIEISLLFAQNLFECIIFTTVQMAYRHFRTFF